MQKTAKGELIGPSVQNVAQAYAVRETAGFDPFRTKGDTFQWDVTDHGSANIVWQDTTSAATYTSASSVLEISDA